MAAIIVPVIAGAAVMISLIADRKKTLAGLKIAVRRFIAILPSFLTMLTAVSIILALISRETIMGLLSGGNRFIVTLIASFLGSVTLMPGFIAFPLAGILLSKGVAYMVLSAFTATLMMVGVLTYPIEKEYFGTKVTIIRNILSFLTAIIVAVITGFFFGEIV